MCSCSSRWAWPSASYRPPGPAAGVGHLALLLPPAIEATQGVVVVLDRACQGGDVFDNLVGLGIGLIAGWAIRSVWRRIGIGRDQRTWSGDGLRARRSRPGTGSDPVPAGIRTAGPWAVGRLVARQNAALRGDDPSGPRDGTLRIDSTRRQVRARRFGRAVSHVCHVLNGSMEGACRDVPPEPRRDCSRCASSSSALLLFAASTAVRAADRTPRVRRAARTAGRGP